MDKVNKILEHVPSAWRRVASHSSAWIVVLTAIDSLPESHPVHQILDALIAVLKVVGNGS